MQAPKDVSKVKILCDEIIFVNVPTTSIRVGDMIKIGQQLYVCNSIKPLDKTQQLNFKPLEIISVAEALME